VRHPIRCSRSLGPAGGDAVTEYKEFLDEHARIMMVRWPEDD
jgi:hypothetical protein